MSFTDTNTKISRTSTVYYAQIFTDHYGCPYNGGWIATHNRCGWSKSQGGATPFDDEQSARTAASRQASGMLYPTTYQIVRVTTTTEVYP